MAMNQKIYTYNNGRPVRTTKPTTGGGKTAHKNFTCNRQGSTKTGQEATTRTDENTEKGPVFERCLSDEGIEACTKSVDNVPFNDIIRIALNSDLRSIGKPFLPSEINSGRVEKLEGPCILQVQKIRNVSAPKDNEESQGAPRMLRLQMTDGHTNCLGIEFKHLSKISVGERLLKLCKVTCFIQYETPYT
ncbi:UNVERIFIED_CONTAM: hypothetical protein FKN15_015955 [Acipenser sinensis]